MEFLWQAIAVIAVLGLSLLLLFAILEPGPLQKRRSFGKPRTPGKSEESAETPLSETPPEEPAKALTEQPPPEDRL